MSDVRTVERNEDMSPLGRLALLFQPDGDVIVAILADPRELFRNSVEFCQPGAGGGRSPLTIKALRAVAEAMEQDNADRPIYAEPLANPMEAARDRRAARKDFDRLRALESLVQRILSQANDDHCQLDWGTLYPELAILAGMPDWTPRVLPADAMRRNCEHFIDCFVARQPERYVSPVITELEAALLRAKIEWLTKGPAAVVRWTEGGKRHFDLFDDWQQADDFADSKRSGAYAVMSTVASWTYHEDTRDPGVPTPTAALPATLDDAANELSCCVYEATKLIEDLEHAGLIWGNGHHARQYIAEVAVEQLRRRWKGDAEGASE